jgi:hypothetical protein
MRCLVNWEFLQLISIINSHLAEPTRRFAAGMFLAENCAACSLVKEFSRGSRVAPLVIRRVVAGRVAETPRFLAHRPRKRAPEAVEQVQQADAHQVAVVAYCARRSQ